MLVTYLTIASLLFIGLTIMNSRRMHWREYIFSNLLISVCWPASLLLFVVTSLTGSKHVKIEDSIDLSKSER